MPKVEISQRQRFVKEYVFPNKNIITVGRENSSDIVLADERRVVSRYHAALIRLPVASEECFFVRGLGSLHGRMLGETPIYQQILQDGDIIQIGECQLTYSVASERP